MESALFRLVTGVWAVLPESLAVFTGAAMGSAVGSVLRVRRRDVDRHLAWAFPTRSRSWRRRVARRSYAHLGREAVVLFRRGGWSIDRVLEATRVEGFNEFRAAAEAAGGLILLTGHLGNWEIGGAAITARGVPLDVVAKGMSNPLFQTGLFAARERLGMRVVEMGDAAREGLRSLSEGNVLALLGDQRPHGGGVLVPFFGREAATARGPALLATRTGASVWVAFAVRDPGSPPRYTVRFQPLPFTPSGDSEADARVLMTRYASVLEEAIEAAPEQYFWQHRRWRRRSPEEPGQDPQVTS